MQIADFACCPADAAVEIKQISSFISPFKGGYGCVRDVIEKVLKAIITGHYKPQLLLPESNMYFKNKFLNEYLSAFLS